MNKVYNVYDVNQQTTDDLRVLKATATLQPQLAPSTGNTAIDYLRGATYFVDMPDDYLHLLNCICLFDVNKKKECWNAGDVMVVGATKLTADSWSSVVDDVYNQPTKKRPYYYVHNQNDMYLDSSYELTSVNGQLPTNVNSSNATVASGNATDTLHTQSYEKWHEVLKAAKTEAGNTNATAASVTTAASAVSGISPAMTAAITAASSAATAHDAYMALVATPAIADGDSNFARTFTFGTGTEDAVEKTAGVRHANSSRVKVEIRCGRDKSNIFSLSAVQIDYVKA
ncbi:MAG: hypothetical protein U0L26_07245, partial [Cellulosilyticum sp.]|nr:hypothetical protein [Cellulosilyticum sp.]